MKYEYAINKTAWYLLKGDMKNAKRNYDRLRKYFNDMTPVEMDVMIAHREEIYGRPYCTYSEKMDYYESRCLPDTLYD